MLRTQNGSPARRPTGAMLLALGALFTFVACSDDGPGGVKPPQPEPNPEVQFAALLCTANTGTGQVNCAPADGPLQGEGAWKLSNGGRGGLWSGGPRTLAPDDPSLIIGGQGVNVTLTGTNVVYTPGTQEFTFDVTITNHIGQPLGTIDGSALHSDGVRVFFEQLPVKTGGDAGAPSGPYGVAGHGTASFTTADQPYYQFDEIIGDEQTSGAVQFKFTGVPADITFGFRVLVWAPVQWPDGWVAVTPSADTLDLADAGDQSVALTGTVYSRVGVVMAESITWASSATGVATVDGSGVVTAVGVGSATITASAAGRADGSAAITVVQPVDLTASTVTTSDATLTADGTASTTVTVQLKDASGNNLTYNAGTVALSNSGAGTLGAVTYAGAGAYTATLTAPTTVGVDSIAATLDGTALPDTAVVEYTPGTPAQFGITTEPSTTSPSGVAFTQQPVLQLQDANGNAVSLADVEVVAAIASGGGTLGGTTTVATDANGVAAFTDLSLSGTAGDRTLSFSSSGLTGATSAAITVTFGALDHFLVEAAAGGPIANQLWGTPFNIRITAQDASNNTVTSFTGTVGFTSTPGGGISAGATSGAFTAGVLNSHAITFGTPGPFTLTATRSGGTESGTSSSFDVQAPPTAVNEGPAAGSAPGQPFHAFYSTSGSPQTFTLPAPGVMSNDDLGFPLATVTSFGADSLGGSTSTYAAGSTVSPLPGTGRTTGSLSVAADGSVTFTPPDGFTGNYVFRYRLTNVRGTSDARVTIAVGARPAAVNDTYTPVLVGNVPINTATSTQFRVTANDKGDGKVLAVTGQTNGTAVLNADSTFTFRPTAGYEGPASFTYTVKNGFGTSAAATVSMTVSGMVWFIDDGAAAGGDGRFDAPFNSLASLNAINNGTGNNPAANDRIFLYTGTYAGPLTLLNGQALIGQGATPLLSTVAGVTWPADAGPEPTMNGTAPTITATNATALTLANVGNASAANNTLRGFNIGNVGATGTALAGTNFGTLTVSEVGINTNGRALNLSSGTLASSFSALSSSGGANNVYLNNVTTGGLTRVLGTSSDALSGATGDAFHIDGGNGSFTYAGTITNAATLAVNIRNKNGGTVTLSGDINPSAAGRGISIASNSGGTITFAGPNQKISSGTGTGVNLTNNNGATINFNGGGLSITTTSGEGFRATGGGAVNITGPNNVVSSGTGIAVNINNVTIGGNGVRWRSVSHNGGANGISLINTGNSGGVFTVTGDGVTNGSGGTIVNTTGADGATGGNGIYLSNARNISLSWMALSGHQNNGLFGTGVRGNLLLNKMRFTGNNGSNGTGFFDESAIQLVNHGGATKIINSRLDGGAYNALRVENITGTAPVLDSLVIENDTVAHMQGSVTDVRGSAILVSLSDGSGDVRIRNNRVTYWWGNAINVAIQGTASGTSRITGNFVDNTNGALAGAGGIWVAGGAHSFNISNNTVRHTNGTAISADRVGFGALMQGTIDNNAIGVSGDPNSGTLTGAAIFASHHGPATTTLRISNNVIRQAQAGSGNGAIWLLTGDAAGFGGSGFFNATVSGNNIQESSAPLINGHNGILATIGTQSGPPTDADKVCLDIVGNTILNFNNNTNRVRINARFDTTTRFPGYTGAQFTNADIGAYLTGRNTITQTNSANSSTGGWLNTSPAGSACPQPSM